MFLREDTKTALILSSNTNLINDETYHKLLENCFAVLLKQDEIYRK